MALSTLRKAQTPQTAARGAILPPTVGTIVRDGLPHRGPGAPRL